MASLLSRIAGGRSEERMTLSQYAELLSESGWGNTLGVTQTMKGQVAEPIEPSFAGRVAGAYAANGVVWACIATRQLVFSEARFQYQRMTAGRPGDLFGSPSLSLLESPWPGGTTGDLLSRMLLDVDLAGNSFTARRGNRLRRLRPDWVTIVRGSHSDPEVDPDGLDAELIGYVYTTPGGTRDVLLPGEVAHFAPMPDPLAMYRGMSWLTPILREVQSDKAITVHKLKFFENAATPNMAVVFDKDVKKDQLAGFKSALESQHKGAFNAYKTLYLGGGADVKVIGADMRQINLSVVQGAGETRIAAAAGVPPVIVGLSEGLAAATYSNYGQARRRLADGTIRPLWRNAAGSLANIVPPPDGARLWYDDRDIPFLREDRKDAAEIDHTKAMSIRSLTDAGYMPDSVVLAIDASDMTLLTHSGLYSVQLQAPGSHQPTPAPQGGTQ